MKGDDRMTSTANIITSGSELREIRRQDLGRWKRRISRSIEAQKWDMEGADSLDEIYPHMISQNEAYDMALKIIGAKWKNI